MAHKQIVVVGSINIDLVARVEHIPESGQTLLGSNFDIHPGGKGANQAVTVARLGYPVQLIGQLGSDVFGQQLREQMVAMGVDASCVGIAEGNSGVAVIAVAVKGENSIIVVPGANLFVLPAYLDLHIDVIQNAAAVLAQAEIPFETVLYLAEICAEAKVPLIFDPSPACDLPAKLLTRLTWITPNETEAAFYTARDSKVSGESDPGTIAHSILSLGVSGVVLKMGSRGAYVATAGSETQIHPFPVEATDTTAAGDVFNGAFAVGLLRGRTAVESARFASAAAAISVTRPGAQRSAPTMAEVEDLLQMPLTATSL